VPIVSEQYTRLVGVDTHAATHTLAVVDTATGAGLCRESFPTTQAGLNRAVAWADRRVGGQAALFVVEGVGSYGAGMARTLVELGRTVVEPAAMPKNLYRGRGKSDLLDADRIARSVAGSDVSELRRPREDGGLRTAMQILVVARDEMTRERTRSINALTALMRTFDLGVDARHPLTAGQIGMVRRWRTRAGDQVATATARGEAVRLATRIDQLGADLVDNRRQLTSLVQAQAPQLLGLTGIGEVVAATVLVAWSHPGRVRSEAALASLAGTCPIPASSGNTTRHRLNRGGDRQLNKAIHTIALVRMRVDDATKAYVARRTAEGRTKKEIIRSLKRYITRQLFRALTPKTAPANP
jgi:transposase